MKIDKEHLLPLYTPLVGFGHTKVFPVETITLLITTGTYPQQLNKEVSFLVVDCSSAFNAIIRRPTLNAWRAATSTYHLLMKFPMEYEIWEAHRDQMAASECYIAMLEMDDHLQALSIKERWVIVEPMEDLEEISLDNNIPGRITRVGMQVDPSVHQELALLLKNNQDIFTWSH